MYLQDIIITLQKFWVKNGCLLLQPYDLEKGAGTFNPATFLKSLGKAPWNVCYVEPSQRPTDGRFGENPNRLSKYYQFQVIIKPSLSNIQAIYLNSLKAIGIEPTKHDVRFVEDDWESPTLGASGLGWEVWLDGMEITQFTYFQHIGGFELEVIPVEITYGIERLGLYSQKKDNVFELDWGAIYSNKKNILIKYGDIHLKQEKEFCQYNFKEANTDFLLEYFKTCQNECEKLLSKGLVYPAYDWVMKASHTFNLLDARGVISVSERVNYITKIRNLASKVSELYLSREEAR